MQAQADAELLRRQIAAGTGVPRVFLSGGGRAWTPLPPIVARRGRFYGEPARGWRWRWWGKLWAGRLAGSWYYELVLTPGQEEQLALTVYSRAGGRTRGLALYRFRKRWAFAALGKRMVLRAGGPAPQTQPDQARGADALMMVLRP